MKSKHSLFFTVIIPCKYIDSIVFDKLLPALEKQTLTPKEVIIVPDHPESFNNPTGLAITILPLNSGPANKRDYAAKKASGEYLAFIDADAYPHQNWLQSAAVHLSPNSIAAVCGPNLTPPNSPRKEVVSGLTWSSILGSGAAGSYRNNISPARFVDDYPSSNLIVKHAAFIKAGGFDTHYYPGEDTILCLNLVYKLKQKILYHPSIKIYHYRRPVFIPHLKQVARYGLHRGFFAKIHPKTSLRPGYLLPSLYLFSFILLPLFYTNYPILTIHLLSLLLYLFLLLTTSLLALKQYRHLSLSLLLFITIPLTHLTYAIMFLVGLFTPKLSH